MLNEIDMQSALEHFLTRSHRLIMLDLLILRHDDRNGARVKLGSTSSAKHLHDFEIRVLLHTCLFIHNGVLDDDEMAWQVNTNC